MPTPTYTAIAKTVLSSPQSTVTFNNIPQTYTDLMLSISAKSSWSGGNDEYLFIKINSNTSAIYSQTGLYTVGTSVSSGNYKQLYWGAYNFLQNSYITTGAGPNTFGNDEYYFANYSGNTNKVLSFTGVWENNIATTDNYRSMMAALWSSTDAITRLDLTTFYGANFVSGSRFDLYGIKNS